MMRQRLVPAIAVAACLAATVTTTASSQTVDEQTVDERASTFFPGRLVIDTIDPSDHQPGANQSAEHQVEFVDAEQFMSELTDDTEETGTPLGDTDTAPDGEPELDVEPGPEAEPQSESESDDVTIRVCFDDVVPDRVRTETLAAATYWDDALNISGAVVEIDVYWFDFGDDSILGAAGPTSFILDPSLPHPNAKYPIALANQLLEVDYAEREPCDLTQPSEIVLILNSGAEHKTDADPVTSANSLAIDLQTTLIHELGHGFGFLGSAELDLDDELTWPGGDGVPMMYDLLVRGCTVDSTDSCLVENASDVSTRDLGLLTSGNLWLDTGFGPMLQMQAPAVWESGSSYSHLDETRYGNSGPYALMTPYLSKTQRVRAVDNGTAAVMQELGWPLKVATGDVRLVAHSSGPNSISLSVAPTDLRTGVPPTSLDIDLFTYSSNTEGDLTLASVYRTLVGETADVEIQGLSNGSIYRAEVTGINASGEAGGSASSEPLLPMPIPGDAETVQAVYVTVLGRQPTLDERIDFSTSAQNLGLEAALAGVYNKPRAYDQEAIARLYLGYLDRVPDVGGLEYWSGRIRDGAALSSVAADFLASTRFEVELPTDDEDYVTGLYKTLLGRQPDNGGLGYWVGRLADGEDRSVILIEISESTEHRSKLGIAPALFIAHMQWKDRLPSGDEVNLWVPVLIDGNINMMRTALAIEAIPVLSETSATAELSEEVLAEPQLLPG